MKHGRDNVVTKKQCNGTNAEYSSLPSLCTLLSEGSRFWISWGHLSTCFLEEVTWQMSFSLIFSSWWTFTGLSLWWTWSIPTRKGSLPGGGYFVALLVWGRKKTFVWWLWNLCVRLSWSWWLPFKCCQLKTLSLLLPNQQLCWSPGSSDFSVFLYVHNWACCQCLNLLFSCLIILLTTLIKWPRLEMKAVILVLRVLFEF